MGRNRFGGRGDAEKRKIMSRTLAMQFAKLRVGTRYGIYSPADMEGDADGYRELVAETATEIQRESRVKK